MKQRTHECAAEGCQHVIPARMLMCIDHWRMVPAPLRRDVAAAWRRRCSAVDWSEQIDAVAEHRGAVAKAVAAVKEKQERKAQAGPSGSLFNT